MHVVISYLSHAVGGEPLVSAEGACPTSAIKKALCNIPDSIDPSALVTALYCKYDETKCELIDLASMMTPWHRSTPSSSKRIV